MPNFQITTRLGQTATLDITLPTLTTSRKICIVNDTPSQADMIEGRHMTGAIWSIFWGPLQRLGISRLECTLLSITTAPITLLKNNLRSETLANTPRLRSHLLSCGPNLVVLVGQSALLAASSTHRSINDWRGSVFVCDVSDSPFFGFKCIAVNEPDTLRKDWSKFPLFNLDLNRIARESITPDHTPLNRLFLPACTADEAIDRLTKLHDFKAPVSLDIEGGIGNVTCISFSTHPLLAFNVPLETYTDEELSRVLPVMSSFLDSPVPKVLQNSLYDNFVLSWFFRTPIVNVAHDTMLSGWEIYPELPKGLGTQVSIWTDEPFYKAERKVDDRLVHYNYCCKDSACTLEIHEKHLAVLSRPCTRRGDEAGHGQGCDRATARGARCGDRRAPRCRAHSGPWPARHPGRCGGGSGGLPQGAGA